MNTIYLRLSLLLSAVLLAGTLSAAAALQTTALTVSADIPLQTDAEPAAAYVLREQDGEICIYQDDVLVERTGYYVSMLPEEDRTLLEDGIAASSQQALTSLLEDLCS